MKRQALRFRLLNGFTEGVFLIYQFHKRHR